MMLLLALIGSVAAALLSEFLDSKIRSTDELTQLLHFPNLGTVPDFREGDAAWPLLVARLRGGAAAESSALVSSSLNDDPEIAEVYRNIRTNILLSRAEEPPRTILFTSAEESEGKTLTTLSLAVSFAQLGDPVLVIEADLRRPTACQTLGIDEGAGLTETLTGGSFKSQLVPTRGGFHLLSAGKRPPNPTELLGSRRMQALLAEAQDHFAYILIDGPPLIPVSDAVILVTLVDGVVLVADQKKAPRLSLKRARERLEYARATVLGTILNRADASNDSYGYWEPPPS